LSGGFCRLADGAIFMYIYFYVGSLTPKGAAAIKPDEQKNQIKSY
jgi:hypothetical protein